MSALALQKLLPDALARRGGKLDVRVAQVFGLRFQLPEFIFYQGHVMHEFAAFVANPQVKPDPDTFAEA
ncbi:MAG: hypothetical protein M1547_02910 [Gammaproteobacteria bacterium]|nr:hypothetical protein [Gammaproteobacteria bacterium]